MSGKSEAAKKILEKLLKKTGDVAADDAARAALRKNPEQYAEYLKALDAVYGSAAERAKQMGFSKGNWYHGTTVDIPAFKNEAKGLSTGAQSAKKGFFFASDPSTASDYAQLAAEKGVIREGDKVTTRFLSDTADLHNDAYDKIKDLIFDRDNALGKIQSQIDRLNNTKEILNLELKNKKFPERIPELQKKIKESEDFIQKQRDIADDISKKIKNLDDTVGSQGQNVGAYKLKAGEGGVHVKDYKGAGYRDTTYADEMSKAQKEGKSSVLFKNTYDPGDPNNRVKQSIAAVFEPNQIRSTNAAFDPRFPESSDVLALTEKSKAAPKDIILEKIKKLGGAGVAAAAPPDMNPLNDLKKGYEGYTNARDAILQKFAEQVDLGKNISGVGADPKFQTAAKTAADLVVPDILDAVAPGAAKLGALEKGVGMAAKEAPKGFGKILRFGNEAPKGFGKVTVKKTAQEAVEEANKLKMAQAKPPVNQADIVRSLESESGQRLKQLRDQRNQFEVGTKEHGQAQEAYQSLLQEMVNKIRNR